MNKKLIFLISFISLFCVAFFVSAAGVTIENPLPQVNSFGDLFNDVALALMGIIAALGTVALIVSGILFMTSAGSPEKIKTAKSALIYGCVGIGVGLSAVGIANAVKAVKRGATDFAGVIQNIATQVGDVTAGIGTVMIVVAGVIYLTSAGSPEKIKLAKTVLIYAIVGIILGLAAPTLVTIISDIFKS